MKAEAVSLFDSVDELTRLRNRLANHYRGQRLTAAEFTETLERVVVLAYGENAAETEAGAV